MKKQKCKSFTILGTSMWRIIAYFIIYSFVGFVIETIFAMVMYNVVESRQSFLYGPFCGIYGVGAVFMYVILNRFFKQKNNHWLFWGGFAIGSMVEYILSLIGEMMFNVRWWDYSNRFLNINGRICFLYSVFWGLLAVYFMRVINPRVDKIINYIKNKVNIKMIKTSVLIIFILLMINCIVSAIAVDCYLTRQAVQNDLDVPNKDKIIEKYNVINENKKLVEIINNYWNDEKMVKTYPNLAITLNNGTSFKVKDLIPDIKPYYYKFE